MSLVSQVRAAGRGSGGGEGAGAGRDGAYFEHVIVLTKMDKRESKDVTAVLEMVQQALLETGVWRFGGRFPLVCRQ